MSAKVALQTAEAAVQFPRRSTTSREADLRKWFQGSMRRMMLRAEMPSYRDQLSKVQPQERRTWARGFQEARPTKSQAQSLRCVSQFSRAKAGMPSANWILGSRVIHPGPTTPDHGWIQGYAECLFLCGCTGAEEYSALLCRSRDASRSPS